MAQDVIEQLQELCGRLREQLMQQPEYRALISLEKTIEDLSVYMGVSAAPARAQPPAPEPVFASEPEAPVFEPPVLDVTSMDPETAIGDGADQLADALVDALRTPKVSTARTLDHLPSHRVA